MALAKFAKPAGTWRYEDLASLPDDGTRYEIIDGDLYELGGPRSVHARVIARLIVLLLPVLDRLGAEWVNAPLDVFFAGANPVEPDIMVLLPGSRAQFVDNGIIGPPDLLIEVVTPANREHDTVRKRALYARGGVREYWIVDPEFRAIEVIGAEGETLERVAADGDGELRWRSPLLGEFALDAAEMFPRFED
ncbi:MAG: Uma2 family endonuclease [Thermomicrobiales bacterium]